MKEQGPLINKIAKSPLITIDLETLIPETEIIELDLKPFLFREMILKESDFREAMEAHDWEKYNGRCVAVYCSTDAIIPKWAYMLISIKLDPFADKIVYGDKEAAETELLIDAISGMDVEEYSDKPVIIKGCGDRNLSPAIYLKVTRKLLPVAKAVMFGEACSTVPLYKKRKKEKK